MTLQPAQFKMYHGTDKEFSPGDVVQAMPSSSGPLAWAARHPAMAQMYAEHVHPQEGQQSMFGHIYEVETLEDDDVHHFSDGVHSTSKKGFRVVRHVSAHPIRSRDNDHR